MSHNPMLVHRRGAVAVLAALFLVVLLAIVAFAVDLGLILVAKTDLQRSADAAAHAAVLELRYEHEPTALVNKASQTASEVVAVNRVLNKSLTLATDQRGRSQQSDVTLGHIDFSNTGAPMTVGNRQTYNAARVRVRRDDKQNGELPLFFSRILGRKSVALEAEATAAVIRNVGSLSIPRGESSLPFLPIVINHALWNNRLTIGADNYSWHPTEGAIRKGKDGIPEVVLFPSDTGSSGNLGTVRVGPDKNNSTSKLAGQIRHGLSQSDLDYHGGKITIDQPDGLALGGDPGLSASIQDDLTAIAGEPRIIGLFSEVDGSGANSQYTIVKFVATRIMAVQLSGGVKHVTVQPAPLTFKGVAESENLHRQTSDFIYSPPIFIQ